VLPRGNALPQPPKTYQETVFSLGSQQAVLLLSTVATLSGIIVGIHQAYGFQRIEEANREVISLIGHLAYFRLKNKGPFKATQR